MTYWGQQDDEDTMWYFRFWLYLSLGPNRSFLRAYKIERAEREARERRDVRPRPQPLSEYDKPITSLPRSWQLAIRRHCWRDRAAAYDRYRISRLQNTLRHQTEDTEAELLSVVIAMQPVLLRKLATMVERLDPDDTDAHSLARILEATERLFAGGAV